MKCTQDNEFVLFINVIQLFFVFFESISLVSVLYHLANKVIVHFAAFIFEFTNFQFVLRDFSFDIER